MMFFLALEQKDHSCNVDTEDEVLKNTAFSFRTYILGVCSKVMTLNYVLAIVFRYYTTKMSCELNVACSPGIKEQRP
jgi:hypothetical protein